MTEVRLRRIADVQRQRLRQPPAVDFRYSTPRLFDLFLCFHRHSRIVRRILKAPERNEGAARPAVWALLAFETRVSSRLWHYLGFAFRDHT